MPFSTGFCSVVSLSPPSVDCSFVVAGAVSTVVSTFISAVCGASVTVSVVLDWETSVGFSEMKHTYRGASGVSHD